MIFYSYVVLLSFDGNTTTSIVMIEVCLYFILFAGHHSNQHCGDVADDRRNLLRRRPRLCETESVQLQDWHGPTVSYSYISGTWLSVLDSSTLVLVLVTIIPTGTLGDELQLSAVDHEH